MFSKSAKVVSVILFVLKLGSTSTITAGALQNYSLAAINGPYDEPSAVVQWKHVPVEEIFDTLKTLVPAGVEPGPFWQFLCRGYFLQRWIPGKLVFNHFSNQITCDVAASGEQRFPIRDTQNIQILTTPAHALSWIPAPADWSIPPNAVIGGYNSVGEVAPICRHKDGAQYVYTGKYHQRTMACWYWFNNGEVGKRDNVEVLVVNLLGTWSSLKLDSHINIPNTTMYQT